MPCFAVEFTRSPTAMRYAFRLSAFCGKNKGIRRLRLLISLYCTHNLTKGRYSNIFGSDWINALKRPFVN